MQRYKEGMAAAVSAPVEPGDPRYAEVMRINLEDLREGKLSANMLLQDSRHDHRAGGRAVLRRSGS